MSTLQDVFALAKKILLVSEQLDRLTEETKSLARTATDHEIRLVRIETTLDLTHRSSKLILPRN